MAICFILAQADLFRLPEYPLVKKTPSLEGVGLLRGNTNDLADLQVVRIDAGICSLDGGYSGAKALGQ